MTTYFAEVLARESAQLAEVTDEAKLVVWRHRVVEELMNARSPYTLALRHTGDPPERADFHRRWRDLIADAINRLLRFDAMRASGRPSTPARAGDVDPEKTAVLILAALHGGSTLSQVAQDSWPLNAALDIALSPFAAPDEGSGSDPGPGQ